jgi:hypothetical protein
MANNSMLTDYDKVITSLFTGKFVESKDELPFTKVELTDTAKKLKIQIKNVPDVIYTYRVRRALPDKILRTGNWILVPKGKKVCFCKNAASRIHRNSGWSCAS